LRKVEVLSTAGRGGELRTGGTFVPSGEKAGLEGLTVNVVFREEFVAQKAKFSLKYLVISFIAVVLKQEVTVRGNYS